MSDAAPAPALLHLKQQLDAAHPSRSRAGDGIMGDAAHQARPSDHNQGNALDVTYDPANGPDLDALADVLMLDPRTRYVIWKGRIRNVEIENGAWRLYTGTDDHTHHLHLSIYAGRRDDEGDWNLQGGGGSIPAAGPEAEPQQQDSGGGFGFFLLMLLGAGLGAWAWHTRESPEGSTT